ncbi:MAG TPA: SdpI family protein [Polyangiaceae bacterium]
MKIRRAELLGLGFVMGSFALVAAFYERLPALVPTHWNARGVADGFMPKQVGAFLSPAITASVWILFLVIPRVSPRGYRIERFQTAYDIINLAMLAVFFSLGVIVLLAGSGARVPMERAVPVAVGALFLVIGNFMGKVTKNFFLGIRTPWTLANDEVWLRTHRLGGKLLALAGLAMIASGVVGGAHIVILPVVLVAVFVPIAYSYFLYRKLES